MVNNFNQMKIVDILDVTFFTDETWFHLSGYVNTQNTQLWSSEIPHALHENPCMTRHLECGLRYPYGTLFALYLLKIQ
jgi:hypothetical protein